MLPSCNVVALFWLAAFGVSEPQLQRFQDVKDHMGTKFQFIVYAPNESAAVAAIERGSSRIAALDDMLSDFKPESVISRLSVDSPTQRSVDSDVFRVLARAEHFSRLTDGAFDVTVGPLTKLWRRARRRELLPLIKTPSAL